jgi:hypothetical protein
VGIERIETPLFAIGVFRRRNQKAIADDDWAAIAGTRQWCSPDDIRIR